MYAENFAFNTSKRRIICLVTLPEIPHLPENRCRSQCLITDGCWTTSYLDLRGSVPSMVLYTHSLVACLWGRAGVSAYPSIWPSAPAESVHKSRGNNVLRVWMLQRGHCGDGCVLASTCVMFVVLGLSGRLSWYPML